ncbi:replication protein A 14 kDa subunit-like isoform X1 [Panulirus ornatus]|uniref:replication protein A 14 kDa subunit-like isoform X1 n=1 Tax=Panulirus ornatus TaxID=150431 RepID=UPI003A8AA857
MVSTGSDPRIRVNAATLPQFNGQNVILLGEVDKIDPSGMMMLVKASDGQPIQVKLQQPLQGNVEGIVEIHGIGQSRQVMCQNYVSFPLEYSASFDMQGYDQAVRLIHSVPGNPWKFD